MTLHPNGPAASPPVRVAARQFPANGADMCRKGWTAADLLASPDRLRSPLVRDRSAFVPEREQHRPAEPAEKSVLLAGSRIPIGAP